MKRLLLVEDDADDAALTMLGLVSAGFASGFEFARDGVEALELVSSGYLPELIVTDLKMPRVDGVELTRRLRELGLKIPVVVLTSSSREEDRRQALAAGAVDYFIKPMALNGYTELARGLERLLEPAASRASSERERGGSRRPAR